MDDCMAAMVLMRLSCSPKSPKVPSDGAGECAPTKALHPPTAENGPPETNCACHRSRRNYGQLAVTLARYTCAHNLAPKVEPSHELTAAASRSCTASAPPSYVMALLTR